MGDILIVDDERDIRELVSDILRDEGYGTRTVANSEQCLEELQKDPPGLMILDIWLKDSRMDGIDILKHVKSHNPSIPVVIISGHGNIEIAVAAIKQGAYDFIEKPFNIDQLTVVVRRAMETSRLRRENSELRRGDAAAVEMIGASPAFNTLKSQLDKVTRSNGRVMLTGQPGTGKESAARYIHANSGRADKPFVVLNSAAVEPGRVEELLFGRESVERGLAPGLLEQADGGVLYMDEVAEMPLGAQSKVLRVLTEQQFTRVGGTDRIGVDVRVISSTNRNLPAEIESGRFRSELYHRLNVVPIDVPSLSERREDVPRLAEHFIAALNRDQGLPLRRLSDEAATLLQTMAWPGNVRQLRNVIERVLILGPEREDIAAEEVPADEGKTNGSSQVVLSASLATLPLREAREVFEREYLMAQINRFGGNISRTASFVGMERSALHRKLKSLNVVTSTRSGARVACVGTEEDA
ncbi:nitrogen assimilation response regulator NtrX [Roseitranquillus sediminis]|uniref:nitrogen assimilation response regulator NtrX n=1 Tax=Roseitranquillus sediminis TaxID=2809051 RepID=UPI0029CA231B|nr:sigma-54 dependent transcriptional regulator [Roseitranquillus sediminis]